ncbi:MAG: hypothetical protein ACIRZ2_02135 [Ligilactobacillus ruminis]
MASIKKTYSRHMISTRKNTVGRPKNTDYYERYLKQAKKAGLDVYIVEYRAGKELSKKIDAYCERHGYKWYNADGIKLN